MFWQCVAELRPRCKLAAKVRNIPNNTFFDSEPGGREAAPGPLALVQAFVNTREAERNWEALPDPESLRSWLRRRGLLTDGETIEDSDVVRARDVREALRALLAANNGMAGVDGEAIRTLNRAAGRAGLTVRFGPTGARRSRPPRAGWTGPWAGCWPPSTPGWRKAPGGA
jgi:hypothetical protein